MRILHVTPEVAPFSKTGGLGDVLAGLPVAQRAAGAHVVVLSPRYGAVSRAGLSAISRFDLSLDGQIFQITLYSDAPGHHWFLDVPGLLDRADFYGPYDDNPLRFAVFCKAAGVLAGSFDVIECHDWQAALTAQYNVHHKPLVQTVHNLRYRGLTDMSWAPRLGISPHLLTFEHLEFHGELSFLKAGLTLGDALLTVSPTYAQEIQHEPGGEGLSGVFCHRSDAVHGVLNGLDASFDPSADSHLPARYSADELTGKARCKAQVRADYGLGAGPLFIFVGRAAAQKGLDLVAGALDALVARGGTFIALTSGDPGLMTELTAAVARHPGRAGLTAAFDEALAHRLYGAADFVMVPSRFEPCGLTQLIGMAYGAVPLVRKTGGLADTVSEGETGVTFFDPTAAELARAIGRCVDLYHSDAYASIQRRGMLRDSSWSQTAAFRAQIYHRLIESRG